MFTLRYSFYLLLLVFVTLSCQPDLPAPTDAVQYVPTTVNSIQVMNMHNLMEKADFTTVKTMDFYQAFLRDAGRDNPAFAKIMTDPAQAGIDLQENFYFVTENLPYTKGDGFVAVLLSVKDRTALEQTLTDLAVKPITAGQAQSYFSLDQTTLAWNDEVILLGMGEKGVNTEEKVRQYLDLPKSSGIAQQREIREFLDQDFDMGSWINLDGLLDSLNFDAYSGILRMTPADYRGNDVRTYLEFAAGKITGKTQLHLSENLTRDLELLVREAGTTDFVSRIPGDDLFFYSTFALQPQGINQWIIEKHMKGIAADLVREQGIEMDDVVQTLNGDVMLASYVGDNPVNRPNLLMAAGIADQAKLQTLLTQAQEKDIIATVDSDIWVTKARTKEIETDTGWAEVTVDPGLYLLSQKDILFLSPNRLLLQQIKRGDITSIAQREAVQALQAQHTVAGFLAAANLLKVDTTLQDMMIDHMLIQGDLHQGKVEIHFQNDQANSLQQLLQWLNRQYTTQVSTDETGI